MNLLELLMQYQRTIREQGRQAADLDLEEMGVGLILTCAIRGCFDDRGYAVGADGQLQRFDLSL